MTSNRHIVDQYAEVEAKLKELSDQKKALREKIDPDEVRKPDVSVTKLSIEDLVKSNAA